jgi:penicillin-binding protein 1A
MKRTQGYKNPANRYRNQPARLDLALNAKRPMKVFYLKRTTAITRWSCRRSIRPTTNALRRHDDGPVHWHIKACIRSTTAFQYDHVK